MWTIRWNGLLKIHRPRLRLRDGGLDSELHRAEASIDLRRHLQLAGPDVLLLKLCHSLHLHLHVSAMRSEDGEASKNVSRRVRVARGQVVSKGDCHRQETRPAWQTNGSARVRGAARHRSSGNCQLCSHWRPSSQSVDHASHLLHDIRQGVPRHHQYNSVGSSVFTVEPEADHPNNWSRRTARRPQLLSKSIDSGNGRSGDERTLVLLQSGALLSWSLRYSQV